MLSKYLKQVPLSFSLLYANFSVPSGNDRPLGLYFHPVLYYQDGLIKSGIGSLTHGHS